MDNFCNFQRLQQSNSLVTNGDITSNANGWTLDDTAPFGDNDQAWEYQSNTLQTQAFGDDWTNGASQIINFKKGITYLFKVTIQSGNANDVRFYVSLVDKSNYVNVLDETLNDENITYTFQYTPSADYEKIMVVAFNSGGGVTYIGRIYDLNIYELNTLFDGDCDYALPMVAGDTLSIYTNFELDDTDIAFSTLEVGLYQDGIYLGDIATLNQVVISGDIYNVYFEWTVPTLPKGNYRFILHNGDEIYYISNSFRYTANTTDTKVIKYRNTKNAFSYRYETATTFYNQFRIDLWKGLPSWPQKSRGYETYEGAFIRTKADTQKLVPWNMSYVNEGVLEAFSSALLHDELYLDDVEYEKPDGENISVDWSQEDLRIGTGIVNLQEVSYSKSIESC